MNPNPKPKPPLPGGEYTHASDPGTPPLPSGVRVVKLIPVGDGGPGTLRPRMTRRKKRKPLLPSVTEIEQLPWRARAAFAARCASRLPPLDWDPQPTDHFLEAVKQAVGFAEVTRNPPSVIAYDDDAYDIDARHIDVATHTAHTIRTALHTAQALLHASSDPRDLLFIRRDFDLLRRLVKANKWTDDTPVSQDVFGPLWPGRVPKWARETNGPRG